ncbi:Brp/Blh family beta-carotene 15,15'-dioxygenase [Undibacterium sp. RTI2.1]|uniref:Brp/Blh family beta-carotene 15,15'-dioxygenase n=1 Tax=unclassified Undibacterium TaxID=2630295 RepID=UPI002B23158B|nr:MULTISPECIES: Brp/Blh family beta-carotene 15,15'-dioxygenase [unclassified Undibacterium]MEB0033024.1 Brp/Blh family beta-carotene 15,15'-dioxygenase [Undibacterium sp. RTI2.1]MEB0118882.1 Brp/Blh family beta-carotene 15,15'-dioxygenase [Undibacterium sp. RTI2.2]
MNSIQIQRLVFFCLTILATLISMLIDSLDPLYKLLFITSLVLFLGVPHGALDLVFAKQLFLINGWQSWLKFTITYLALSLSVVIVWWHFSMSFMVSFLLLSMLHFSRDLILTRLKITRFLYGGAIIVLPTILHSDQMTSLFALILNEEMGQQITSFLKLIALPWLISSVACFCIEWIENKSASLELFSVCYLAVLAEPLIGFAIFFCGMHSYRHILRTQHYSKLSFKQLLIISLAPMIGTILLAATGWFYLPPSPNYPRITQFLFVTLGALTLPHMLLIDRIKFIQ